MPENNRIVLIITDRPPESWKKHLLAADPDLQIDIWPNIADEASYSTAVVWKQAAGLLGTFPGLRLISSLGAGVDHLVSDPALPAGVAVCRIVDDQLKQSMSNFVVMGVLNYQRGMYDCWQNRVQGLWQKPEPVEKKIKIGILGVGALGRDAALKLKDLGFEVSVYSNAPKNLEGIRSFSGEKGLEQMLSKINLLINLLPLTSATRGILNKEMFSKMQPGTYLIQVARGAHLVENDLLMALDEGYLSGALLDVFEQEPLPQVHPFWRDERIMLTPHIASVTDPAAAARQIVENHHRLLDGRPLLNQVDLSKEY